MEVASLQKYPEKEPERFKFLIPAEYWDYLLDSPLWRESA